jgi:hypothetical protein
MYSVTTGIWKSIKNGLIVIGPALVAGVLEFFNALPPDISTKYALWIGLATYFIKNWFENRD